MFNIGLIMRLRASQVLLCMRFKKKTIEIQIEEANRFNEVAEWHNRKRKWLSITQLPPTITQAYWGEIARAKQLSC